MASQLPARYGPKLGKKQIFLPNFVLTLLRTPEKPATFASFVVPLKLNKLDMRDYMWNVYGIHCRGVRSYIQRQKLRQDKPGAKRPKPRQWFRPRSVKKMLIEMERPFVWPEEPDLEKWDKKTHDAAEKEREENEEQFSPDARKKPTKERVSIKGQARPLLRAKARTDFNRSEEGRALRARLKARRKKAEVEEEEGEWVDDGEAVEVETDVDVSKVPRS